MMLKEVIDLLRKDKVHEGLVDELDEQVRGLLKHLVASEDALKISTEVRNAQDEVIKTLRWQLDKIKKLDNDGRLAAYKEEWMQDQGVILARMVRELRKDADADAEQKAVQG